LVDVPTAAPAAGTSIIGSATAGKADNLAVGVALTTAAYGRVASPLTYDAAAQEVLVDLDVPETT
jgi:hypothetical protein